MKLDFSVEKTVKQRQSVRNYQERPLTKSEREQIEQYIEHLSNPFSVAVSFHLLDHDATENGEKLGTYGVIKGASNYVGASVGTEELNLEALGYSFEALILYLTSLGFGTCWLGGTFDRSKFAAAMHLNKDSIFPAISPIGIPTGKRRVSDRMTRWAIKADQRLLWQDLFFDSNFSTPLNKDAAGDYAFPLEMLRLAPSAVNKQPWRIVKEKDSFHFYEFHSLKENKHGIDIQRTDVGIGACHFHLAALEKGLSGHLERLNTPEISAPEKMEYRFSWIAD
ncbi:MAG: hypothetical protein PWP24_176 [Clostridiales bacterium]|nr:hypothetical protein [Clostridiales bacterium]